MVLAFSFNFLYVIIFIGDNMGLLDKLKRIIKKEDKVYEDGLSKARETFTDGLNKLSKKYKNIDDSYFEELEELLIGSDIGVSTVIDFIDKIKDRVKREKISSVSELTEIIIDELFIIYVGGDIIVNKISFNENGPTVILFVGVNGVGKTTTIGKLAKKLNLEGKRVLMVAGDTFRAGAIAQLEEWASRTESLFVRGEENSDPASVVYKALEKALDEKIDVVLVDTAGRLQNKVNLMNELKKINDVCKKHIDNAPHETFLVIDATTGQNGISQAKAF